MTDRRIDLGPTGETVRQNVTYLREEHNLSFAELSRRLEDAGNKIPPLGLRRIEAGERRVHVDDLAALALVLDTSVAYLLTPQAVKHNQMSKATGIGPAPANAIWEWVRDGTVHTIEGDPIPAQYGRPPWVKDERSAQDILKLFKDFGINVNIPGITDGDS